MSKFIKKIVLFSTVLVLILSLKKGATPYYLGNQDFSKKLDYFQYNQSNFNTVFFGSSMTYRQINTVVIDSVLNEKNIHSYNFGCDGVLNPESYFLYENFIEDIDENQIKYAVLEIQQISFGENVQKNIAKTRANYFFTIPTLRYVFDDVNSSNKSTIEKLKSVSIYLKGFFYSLFDLEILKNVYQGKPKDIGENGFYLLEDELCDLNKKNNSSNLPKRWEKSNLNKKKISSNLQKRWDNFHPDTSIKQKLKPLQIDAITKMNNRIKAARKNYNLDQNERKHINHIHIEKLNNLLLASQKKGIHLFYLLPPRLDKNSYSGLLPVLNSLPQENTLSLYEYQEFDDLYLVENSFDINHLNKTGANIFTKYIGQMMKEKLKTKAEQ